jgi:hypothetical protein
MARGHEPYRRCIQCRTSLSKKELTRVVRKPDWSVVVDLSGKVPGRGAYLCKSKECVEAALKARRLEKALRTKVPDEVVQELLGLSAQTSET